MNIRPKPFLRPVHDAQLRAFGFLWMCYGPGRWGAGFGATWEEAFGNWQTTSP